MTEEKKLAVYEEICRDIVLTDGKEYKVPTAQVFGRGALATLESFGGRSLQENAQRVDQALEKTEELQHVWNRSHSQWTWKHLNLSYHDPYKNMRQIAAEINNKKSALNEAKWRQVENEVKIRKLQEEIEKGDLEYWDEVEKKVELAKMQEGAINGTVYIEGAMKDVLALSELYEQLKDSVSDFDEEDVEKNESRAHLRRSIVQSIRDVRQSGSITKGEQEYLEQIGVNPSRMQTLIRQYVAEESSKLDWSTDGLYEFVDRITKELINEHKVDERRMNTMGFKHEYIPGISHDKKVALKLEKKEEQ